MSRRHVDAAERQLGPDAHLLDRIVNDSPRSTLERVFVLVVVRHLFEDDPHLCGEIVALCERCTTANTWVDKVRNLAAQGQRGEAITASDALSIIKATVAPLVTSAEPN